jgi:hypothetical protein
MIKTKSFVGQAFTINPGTVVARAGNVAKRKTTRVVTIRREEKARGGKMRIFWKSHGLGASTLV